MKRKKVIFFIESFSGGGAERVLFSILRNLNSDLLEPMILVMSDSGHQRKEFHKLNIPIIPVIKSNSFYQRLKYNLLYHILPSSLAAKWILGGIKGDCYVAFVEGYCTRIFSKIKNSRKIAWVHIDLKTFPWPIKEGIFKSLAQEIEAYQEFDKIIGVSESVSEILKTHYGLTRVSTIYNPIDETRILSLASQPIAEKIDSNTFNIISVGRLTTQKGYDKLISIMPRILKINPLIRLYIIGEGIERKHLEELIYKYGLNDSVKLLGYMDNPYAMMAHMDLYVCSSIAEGFSLVCAEAMMCGLPIISMRCAGPNELLGNGKFGILCDSYENLATSIINLSTSPDLLQDLKERSKERSQIFQTSDTISKIAELL